jgi:60 kDa SS-A/Ro ribonucleoprotein
MSKVNVKVKTEPIYTHEGAKAAKINYVNQLKRSVMSYMLWESEFYEDGVEITERIKSLIPKLKFEDLCNIAIECREKIKLRHTPLFIVREMTRLGMPVKDVLARIIQRADEITEFLAIYWKDGKCPLSNQVKKGLGEAFNKFDEYNFSKYNRDSEVKFKDVLFMVHPKAINDKQQELFNKIVNDTLETPDTWEVNLSTGKDKKRTFERMINENKLGGLAILRNLRGMTEANVNESIIKKGISQINTDRILPFRFITAAKYAPQYEPELETKLFECIANRPKLKGKTVMVVDVSGSMYGSNLSKYSEMDRANVACSLAILVRECSDDSRIYATAGNDCTRIHKTEFVPSRRGFALRAYIYGKCQPLGGGGIFAHQVIKYIKKLESDIERIIVITDEQDCDTNNSPLTAPIIGKHNYIINVASNKNGVGYGKWTHIDGFSEAVIDYIYEYENQNLDFNNQ